MLLVLKNLFGATAAAIQDSARQRPQQYHPTSTQSQQSPDSAAEQLWKEWLDDDNWRVSKP